MDCLERLPSRNLQDGIIKRADFVNVLGVEHS
jgi:hypothetical protein